MSAPELIPDDARGYNGELADTFGFQERDAAIAARYPETAEARERGQRRRDAAGAVWQAQHTARRTARITAEQSAADRWTRETAAALRQAGEFTAAELIEARARYFAEARLRDVRA